MSIWNDTRFRGGRGGGSASVHLSFRSGSRAGGACGAAGFDYITRDGPYDDPDRDPVVYTESDHLPSWARENPRTFWDAADLYERANGRLYVSAEFALPRDLSQEDQIELARQFAHDLSDGERLPYTLAIHEGRDADGQSHNPHAHLMFSERRNDGIDRSPSEWFRRANAEHSERGGAPKSRTFHGSRWVEAARERWAERTNDALERAGLPDRVDHRSYERQGIDQEPGHHYGPSAPHLEVRGERHDRLDEALQAADRDPAVRDLDHEIAQLERVRADLLQELLAEERGEGRRDRPGREPDRDDDHVMER